jgi:hypothetical protein
MIWLSVKSSREFKGIAAYIFVGLVFLSIGSFFTSVTVRGQIYSVFPALPALLYITGAMIIILPNYVNPKHFTRALPIWSFLVISVISYILLTPIFLFIARPNIALFILLLISYIPSIFVLIYSSNRIIKILKTKDVRAGNFKEDQQSVSYLKAFARPKKLTEEEVMFYKEKKICLVCKGKLERDIYICPGCDALYCKKCSSALRNLENACWVCETSFDITKPIKKYKKEEIKISEEDINKN